MKLENQLLFREANTKLGRMCSTTAEVATFINDITNYEFTETERMALEHLLSDILPMREFHLSEKRTFALVLKPGQVFAEYPLDEEIPDGCRQMATVFLNAYSQYSGPVATFYFGPDEYPIVINVSRKSSDESFPWHLAQELWAQQMAYFSGADVPRVMADLTPLRIDGSIPSAAGGYTAKIEELEFPVKDKDDFLLLLKSLLSHPVSHSLRDIIDELFLHVDKFPKHQVCSSTLSIYANKKHQLYVGGNGKLGTFPMAYIGKVFPSFFSGLPGNLFLLRIGNFEDQRINIVLARN